MACRSLERSQPVQADIIRKSGNAQVHLLPVDLAALESIRMFAAEFQARFQRLDALINNAAHFDLSQKEPAFTPQGAESVFATNHLGPFLLTHLLLPQLQAAAPASVVNISSQGLMMYPFLKIQFDDLSTSQKRKYSVQYAYYHSKLAQVMFTLELARRLSGRGVTANAIQVPNVRIDVSRYPDIHPVLLKMYAIKQRFAITPEQMAEAYVQIATGEQFSAANGQYFNEKCRQVALPRAAKDQAACVRLWELSAEMVNLPPAI
jgi:NAD(P)-dependent dehydrogenase (short-subunit alcohol dehydrogenase family)